MSVTHTHEGLDEAQPAAGKEVLYRYEHGRGIYVIILNTCFRYMNASMNEEKCLNYSGEKEKWEKLLEGSGHKVYIRENLEPNPVDEKPNPKDGRPNPADGKLNPPDNSIYFDEFIDFLQKEIRTIKPKFVFFYIASHGDVDGNFYLSSRGRGGKLCHRRDDKMIDMPVKESKWCSEHCKDKHVNEQQAGIGFTGSSRCHRRNMTVLIEEISRVKSADFNLVGRPKIFVESFCRGVDMDPGKTPSSFPLGDGDTKPPVTLALQSDTIRLHATVLNRKSYVDGCSWLFDQLYLEAMKYKTGAVGNREHHVKPFTCDQFITAKRKADDINCWIKDEGHGGGSISNVYAEDLLDGWFTDLCRRVCCHVGLKDVVRKTYELRPSRNNWEVVAKENKDKQQPEFTSTLHRKLSCFDLLSSKRLTVPDDE